MHNWSAKSLLTFAMSGLFLSFAPASVAADEAFVCSDAPKPVISLSYQSRYADNDEARVEIDQERKADVLAALKPLDKFVDMISLASADLYEGTAEERAVRATCLVDQLAVWADADALSDVSTETANLTVGSRLAAFSMVLWQTKPYAPDHPDRAKVLDWLEQRIDSQTVFWKDAPRGARVGNLRAWAALAAAATAQQTGRTDHQTWAVASLRDVMCTAEPDGSLPQEMSRGRFALHYQLHAIAPLVTASVLLERQGVRASTLCDGALHRIVHFAMSDLFDGSKTKAKTGVAQSLFDGSAHLTAFQLAWIEPYMVLKRTETLEATAEALRPLIYSKLGGNQTRIWQ